MTKLAEDLALCELLYADRNEELLQDYFHCVKRCVNKM